MITSELLLATCNAIVKYVDSWPAERLMLFRFSITAILSSLVCIACGVPAPSRLDLATIVLRGLAYCSGILFFWAALRSCLPIGDVVVLLLSASPLFLVLLARVFLSEKIPREWPVQMLLLIFGATLISKPLAPSDDCPASTVLLPTSAAVCWAFMNFGSRRVKHLPSVQVMLINDIIAVVFACAYALIVRGASGAGVALQPPLTADLAMVAASAVLGWLGLMGNIKGYQSVSVAAVASIAGATSIPFNYVFQLFLFHEPPDVYSSLGAAIVIATPVGMAAFKHLEAKRQADILAKCNAIGAPGAPV